MTTLSTQRILDQLRSTQVWKSIFRRGPARTNRTRSLAVFGSLFLHILPVKVRDKSLRVRDRKSTRLNSSHSDRSRMPSSA